MLNKSCRLMQLSVKLLQLWWSIFHKQLLLPFSQVFVCDWNEVKLIYKVSFVAEACRNCVKSDMDPLESLSTNWWIDVKYFKIWWSAQKSSSSSKANIDAIQLWKSSSGAFCKIDYQFEIKVASFSYIQKVHGELIDKSSLRHELLVEWAWFSPPLSHAGQENYVPF